MKSMVITREEVVNRLAGAMLRTLPAGAIPANLDGFEPEDIDEFYLSANLSVGFEKVPQQALDLRAALALAKELSESQVAQARPIAKTLLGQILDGFRDGLDNNAIIERLIDPSYHLARGLSSLCEDNYLNALRELVAQERGSRLETNELTRSVFNRFDVLSEAVRKLLRVRTEWRNNNGRRIRETYFSVREGTAKLENMTDPAKMTINPVDLVAGVVCNLLELLDLYLIRTKGVGVESIPLDKQG